MRIRLFTATAVALATAALVIGVDGVTYAATGQSLLLGRTNYASSTTVVQSTSGAALDLRPGRTTDAPLTVSGSGLVTHLNADRIDSLDSTQLQRKLTGSCGAHQALVGIWSSGAPGCRAVEPTTLVATAAHPGAVDEPVGARLETVPAGRYVAHLAASLTPAVRGTVTAPKLASCQLQSSGTTLVHAVGTDTGLSPATPIAASAVITVSAGAPLELVCGFHVGTWTYAKGGTATVALTPLPYTRDIDTTSTGSATLR
jgi:hypothetical protein